jgi:hypothetical protein
MFSLASGPVDTHMACRASIFPYGHWIQGVSNGCFVVNDLAHQFMIRVFSFALCGYWGREDSDESLMIGGANRYFTRFVTIFLVELPFGQNTL